MKFDYYSLIIYPNISKDKITLFSKKYGPHYGSVGLHITLIFPIRVPTDMKEDELISHIKNVTNKWKTFNVKIKGLELAWDNWLFLLIKKGNSKITQLHDELYSGKLKPFLRKDIEFIPHIAIGSFTQQNENYDLRDPKKLKLDKERYKKSLKEAKDLDIGYDCIVDKFSLVKLNSELKNCKLVREFLLN